MLLGDEEQDVSALNMGEMGSRDGKMRGSQSKVREKEGLSSSKLIVLGALEIGFWTSRPSLLRCLIIFSELWTIGRVSYETLGISSGKHLMMVLSSLN